jgi:hypothetical protein
MGDTERQEIECPERIEDMWVRFDAYPKQDTLEEGCGWQDQEDACRRRAGWTTAS